MFFKKKTSGAVDAIVVGLGNPGDKYKNTRHNTGFCAADYIAQRLGTDLSRLKFEGLYAQADCGSKKILLIKPQTFMNNSGRCVAAFASFFKVPAENIFVIFDDVSLDTGKMRIRKNGSAGGHNGIKSIIECLGSQDFPRIKIGVGKKPNPEYDLADWVLGSLCESDRKTIGNLMPQVYDALCTVLNGDFELAMSKYN